MHHVGARTFDGVFDHGESAFVASGDVGDAGRVGVDLLVEDVADLCLQVWEPFAAEQQVLDLILGELAVLGENLLI